MEFNLRRCFRKGLGHLIGLCFLSVDIMLSDLMIFIAIYCQGNIRGTEREETNKNKSEKQ